MRVITRALTGAATLAIIGGMSATAYAQDAAPADDSIVVTGIRASLESAQERKRTADAIVDSIVADDIGKRSEEHTSELQSLMRISYAVFCLKKKKTNNSVQDKANNIHLIYNKCIQS